MKILSRKFYARNPKTVAIELLGKVIVRKVGNKKLSGMIVETEAYYGDKDPASRAYKGKKKYNSVMWDLPGKLFIYMVHGYWLLNIVAHEKDSAGVVLIRALEPLDGVDEMIKNRRNENIRSLTNGPGKLTKAMQIDKKLNGLDVTKRNSELTVVKSGFRPKNIARSYRIGVTKDLPEKLRFYLKGNNFVSR